VSDAEAISHLFVYGTLQPGDERWPHLAPYVTDEGTPDTVPGRVYDTGLNYPAAVFSEKGTIIGQTFGLKRDVSEECLAHLDDVEAAVLGFYGRVVVTTANGHTAWAYEFGAAADDRSAVQASMSLTPIASGDWTRRVSRAATPERGQCSLD
jgi:gamma-glutamylcyclotransferase (GGCT)/AIG2-like uncharacterized protein YtfP